jgi:hypothetical protein
MSRSLTGSYLAGWRLVGFIALLALLPPSASAQGVNVDAAKKEGKAVIYGTVIPQIMSQIEKGFEAKYGIKTEYWRADATKVIDRVLTEWRSGKPGFDGAGQTGWRLREVQSRRHGEFSGEVQR